MIDFLLTVLKVLGAIATLLASLGIIWKSPLGKVLKWLAEKNIAGPIRQASSALISDTVQPMVDDVKANAKAQHDEQNERLSAIGERLSDHSRRLTAIEDHITRGDKR